ncbi:hypothetical protein D6833_01795 [Candidatus Parcubacteria bacterium]|nr:MAG: hypothetical protein D6833_01795 [Candidatus Parcubacteria bacterium]
MRAMGNTADQMQNGEKAKLNPQIGYRQIQDVQKPCQFPGQHHIRDGNEGCGEEEVSPGIWPQPAQHGAREKSGEAQGKNEKRDVQHKSTSGFWNPSRRDLPFDPVTPQASASRARAISR